MYVFQLHKKTCETRRNAGFYHTSTICKKHKIPWCLVDEKLNWNTHIDCLLAKLHRGLSMLKRNKNLLLVHGKKLLYYAQFYSHLHHGISLWGSMCTKQSIKLIEKLQNKCITIISPGYCNDLIRVKELVKLECYKFSHKLVNKLLPENLEKLSSTNARGKSLVKSHKYGTQNKKILNQPTATNNQ